MTDPTQTTTRTPFPPGRICPECGSSRIRYFGLGTERLEEEVGDLFFVLVNIARYLSVDPESALRKTNRKFRRRFQWMEARLHEAGRASDDAPVEELESLWQEAKAHEREAGEKTA